MNVHSVSQDTIEMTKINVYNVKMVVMYVKTLLNAYFASKIIF